MLSKSSVESRINRSETTCSCESKLFEMLNTRLSRASDSDEIWLTSEEAAAFLKISSGTLRNLTSNGKIPFYKFGRRNRYKKSDLHIMLLSESKGAKYGD